MSRRALVFGTLAALPAVRAARAAAPPEVNRIGFEVLRHGAVIGTHSVHFEPSGGTLLARIDCDLRVGFGPITLFRYRHQALERWEAGQFHSLQTETDNNGTRLAVRARRTGDGVEIRTGDGAAHVAPADALPLTHWNLACMGAPLFNPQDGTLLSETATCAGPDRVALADGRLVAATRYALKGAAPIDDWYERDNSWTALRARLQDGSELIYRRAI